jgi:hypothetical protein
LALLLENPLGLLFFRLRELRPSSAPPPNHLVPVFSCEKALNIKKIKIKIEGLGLGSNGLQYPEVIHCRIVPVEKLKTLAVLERRKPPNTVVLSEFKRSNLKVTRKFVKTPRGLHDRGGGGYFHETFVRHHRNTKYTIFIECL